MSARPRVLVLHADTGGGRDVAASAVAAALASGDGSARVGSLDVLGRVAPRLLSLAAMAYRNTGDFVPDAADTVLGLARGSTEPPVVRELRPALAGAEAALRAAGPAGVLACDQVVAALAAEVAPRVGCLCFAVVADLRPSRVWAHPGIDLFFVSDEDARLQLAARGVAWDRIVVSGVPCDSAFASSRAHARAGAGARLTVGISDECAEPERVMTAVEAGGAIVVRLPSVWAGPGTSPGAPGAVDVAGAAAGCDIVAVPPRGPALWSLPALGVPMLLVGEGPPSEVANVEHLLDWGAALRCSDGEEAAAKGRFLSTHPERLAALLEGARAVGRPSAAKVVRERVLQALR